MDNLLEKIKQTIRDYTVDGLESGQSIEEIMMDVDDAVYHISRLRAIPIVIATINEGAETWTQRRNYRTNFDIPVLEHEHEEDC